MSEDTVKVLVAILDNTTAADDVVDVLTNLFDYGHFVSCDNGDNIFKVCWITPVPSNRTQAEYQEVLTAASATVKMYETLSNKATTEPVDIFNIGEHEFLAFDIADTLNKVYDNIPGKFSVKVNEYSGWSSFSIQFTANTEDYKLNIRDHSGIIRSVRCSVDMYHKYLK